MSAATGPLTTGHRQGEIVPVAMGSAVQAYKGAAAALIVGTGYGIPLVPTTATHQFIGVWAETILSVAPAGTTFTQVMRRGVWQFDQSGLTAANNLQRAYFSDDHTITTTPGTTYAGIICCVDANGKAWVDIESAVRDLSGSNGGTSLSILAQAVNTNVAGAAQTVSTLTIPAGTLTVGTKIKLRGKLVGLVRTASDTASLTLCYGATVIATLGATFAHATTNWLYFDVEMIIRTAGASGTAVADGLVAAGTAGATVIGVDMPSAAIDTTVAQGFNVKCTFSANNTTDSIGMDIFDIEIVRP